MNKVVLAYSGGLDTSVAVAWLREQYDVEVVTLTVDVGGGSLREGVERRAMSRRRLAGLRRRRARDASSADFVWPHLQAGALYQGAYPLATALARPLIAQLLVEVAQREGADAVAHGCTGKGNDQVRFDVAVHALDPGLEVIAPMRVGMGLTRDQEIDYANARGIEIPITKASPYSIDVNLWGRSCETGVLEDPWVTPPADAYEWTVDAVATRRAPVEIVIGFEGGIPVALDGERLGRGRARRAAPRRWAARTASAASTTSRTAWSASRAARSTRRRPRRSCTRAHRALEGLTLSQGQLRFNRLVADELARLIYDGLWFSALSRDLRGYVASSQRVVSGEVRVRLDHGHGRRRRAALAAVAVRQEPRHVRRGRRVRPRVGGRVHRDLRPAAAGRGGAPRRRRQAPRRGLDVDRSAARRTCRRPSPIRSPPPSEVGRRRDDGPVARSASAIMAGHDQDARPRPRAEPARSRTPTSAARARVPARLRPARDARPRLGRADADDRRRHDRGDRRRGLLVLPRSTATRQRLTLAATNGLDASQVGRSASPAARASPAGSRRTRSPIAVADVTVDERFAWVRGFDIEALRGDAVRAAGWHEQVVGVLNVQTREARDFDAEEIEFLADDRGAARRHRREGPAAGRGRGAARPADRARRRAGRAARRRDPRAADAAGGRARLRRPARRRRGRERAPDRPSTRSRTGAPAATDQVTRLDRLVDSILASVRGEGLTGLRATPFDVVAAIDETVGTLRAPAAPRSRPLGRGRTPRSSRVGDEARFRQVLEHLLENEAKYAPPEQAVSASGCGGPPTRSRSTSPMTAPASRSRTGRACSSRSSASTGARSRGSGHRAVRRAAPDGGDGRPRLDRAQRLRRLAVHGRAPRPVAARGLTGTIARRYIAARYIPPLEVPALASLASPAPVASTAGWPPGEILRDVARGGLAGLLAGVVVGGIGGRLAMRAAALLVPEAAGRFTENGNEIGEITAAGTMALVVFIGLFAGVSAAVIWVTIRPWIPGGTGVRAALAAVTAVGLGSFVLVEAGNPDFAVLGHSPAVVAVLLATIALLGAGVSLADAWLDRRLPHPTTARSTSAKAFAALAGIGAFIGLLMIVPAYLLGELRLVGLALTLTGIATIAWWSQRVGGAVTPRPWTAALGRIGLALSVAVGFLSLLPRLTAALGLD